MVQVGDGEPRPPGQQATTGAKVERLLLVLTGVVILQMVANLGLFLRMSQLQRELLAVLRPLWMVQSSAEAAEALAVGAKAPAFRLLDTEERLVGLEDFAGRKVLLAFSSVRCPPCRERYLDLRLLSEQCQDLQVVMISQGSSEENRRLVDAQRFSFPVLTWDDSVAMQYQVPGTPFFLVIDDHGVIVAKGFANTAEQLKELASIEG